MRVFILILLSLYLISTGPAQALDSASTNPSDPTMQLIQALGCKGCHTIKGQGGSLAPDLTQIGSRMTALQIRDQLVAPVNHQPEGFMPSYSTLRTEQLETISQYLYNLR